MNDEEKEAIKNAKSILKVTTFLSDIGHKDLEILVDLINKQDKVIKLMTNYLAKEDISEAFCKTEYKNIDCSEKDYRCEDCIKEYFYKKAEEEND